MELIKQDEDAFPRPQLHFRLIDAHDPHRRQIENQDKSMVRTQFKGRTSKIGAGFSPKQQDVIWNAPLHVIPAVEVAPRDAYGANQRFNTGRHTV